MKNNRRDFLRRAGVAGTALMAGVGQSQANNPQFTRVLGQRFNMQGYAAPKLDTVRIGIIGVGSRGSGTLRRLAGIEGVDIKAICDIVPERVNKSIKAIKKEFPQYNPKAYTGKDDWKRVCEREDIDLIYTATPWSLHTPIVVYAMENNKHAFTELPVGITVDDCWQVVETSERTKKHCYMEGSDCSDGISAVVLNMARKGFFGEVIHGEGAYIHDRVSDTQTRWVRDKQNNDWFGYRPWRLKENVNRNGNLYPIHGLGPVAQILGINSGDSMDYLVSVSGDDFTMKHKMAELAEMDEYYKPYVGLDFRGNMNTTIIRTKLGKTIMLQHDISSPRPNVRFNMISGTKGMFCQYPYPAIAMGHDWMPSEEFDALVKANKPGITSKFETKVQAAKKVSTGRSYERVTAGDWRLIDCLRNGLPLDKSVYDAALWSAITPLSEWSVGRQGAPVKVPDFTDNSWKTNKSGMDLSINNGGTTGIL